MKDTTEIPPDFHLRRFLHDHSGLSAIEGSVHERAGWLWANLAISDGERAVELDFSTNAKDAARVLNKADRLVEAVSRFREALNESVADILAQAKEQERAG